MPENKDYYAVLGVPKTATKDEIKSAYRKLAMKYHPDRNKEPGAEKKFMEIQEAYDVLKDDEKRKTYDQFGSAAFEQGGFGTNNGNPFGAGGFGFNFNGDDLNDIFSQFMGGGRRRSSRNSGPQKGDDLAYKIKISFMDAINGKKVTLPNYTYEKSCNSCNGTGAKNGTDFVTCPHCNGTGRIRSQSRSIFGIFESEEQCPYCNGTGKMINNKCPDCNGSGYIKVKEDLLVNIPAGINNGQQIKIKEKGGRGLNGGPNGDLYIEINVAPHQTFTRQGNDIHISIPIDFVDAALGIVVNVPTVYENSVELKIPAGVQPENILRMKGMGVKDLRTGNPGDQYVHLKIMTPTNLNKNQKEYLKKFKEEESDNDNIFKKFMKNFKK